MRQIAARRSYIGKGKYNEAHKVPNPERPLGDLTMGIPRTVVRPKPKDGRPGNERVEYMVPALTDEETWRKSNEALTERGRGRGKEGKRIQALLRTRIMCPGCGKPMSVMRRKGRTYYYCRERYLPWVKDPCMYRKFIPGQWDEEIWEGICEMLRDDAWVEAQLGEELKANEHVEQMVKLKRWKIRQAEGKLRRVEEGYDGGFYTLEEAREKRNRYQHAIDAVEEEIRRLEDAAVRRSLSLEDVELLREELTRLKDRNLEEAAFEERRELVATLGIRVWPSEDLMSRRVACRLNLRSLGEKTAKSVFAKSMAGGPRRTVSRTFSLTFSLT